MSHLIHKGHSKGNDDFRNDGKGNSFYHGDKDKRTTIMLERYGWIIIFLSPWIPIGGDVIPVIAGVKKYNFKKFVIVMSIGKTVKAVAIVYLLAIIVPAVFH